MRRYPRRRKKCSCQAFAAALFAGSTTSSATSLFPQGDSDVEERLDQRLRQQGIADYQALAFVGEAGQVQRASRGRPVFAPARVICDVIVCDTMAPHGQVLLLRGNTDRPTQPVSCCFHQPLHPAGHLMSTAPPGPRRTPASWMEPPRRHRGRHARSGRGARSHAPGRPRVSTAGSGRASGGPLGPARGGVA
jgi:hypothetical protein